MPALADLDTRNSVDIDLGGSAIGTASALPVSIERIGLWVKSLEGHGVMLAPLTTAITKSKSS